MDKQQKTSNAGSLWQQLILVNGQDVKNEQYIKQDKN